MLILLNKAPCSTKSKLDISMLNQTASDFTKAFFLEILLITQESTH